MKALVTKVRPGSISEAISLALHADGYQTTSLPTELDIRDIDQWDYLTIMKYLMNRHVLVNCVGVTDCLPIDEWSYREANRVVDTNLTAAIALTATYVRATKELTGPKVIIHLGSLWSRKCATGGAAYCASKAGLAHYVECAGYELHKYGYTVVGIHPGNVIGTPMTSKVQQNLLNKRNMSIEQVNDIYKDAIYPADIAVLCRSIISQAMDGSQWLNGENIYLGGGDKR